jgi:CRISPR-associated exonuclease Cas4
MFDEDNYLLISGIQHLVICRRQWALIHVEGLWAENSRTVGGELMHGRVHGTDASEKRGDTIVTRGMPVFSRSLCIQGVCDAVEFHRDAGGVSLFGREGTWLPLPVEYKAGKPKLHDADKLQLCAQACCLEEMLLCPPIETAYIYYGETRRREAVELGGDLREKLKAILAEMRDYQDRRHTPRVKPAKGCHACSMKDECLPKLPQKGRVAAYIKDALEEDDAT